MHSCFYQYPMFQCFRFVLLFFYLSCSFCSLSSPVVYGIFLLFCFTLIFFCCLDCLTYSFFLFLSSYFNWMVFLFFSFHFALCYVYMPCSCYCFTEFFFSFVFFCSAIISWLFVWLLWSVCVCIVQLEITRLPAWLSVQLYFLLHNQYYKAFISIFVLRTVFGVCVLLFMCLRST